MTATETYEVQYRDGLGVWRRWAVKHSIPAADASRVKCERFLQGSTLVRVVWRPA